MTTPGNYTNTHLHSTPPTQHSMTQFLFPKVPPTKKTRKTLTQQSKRSREEISCANRVMQYLYSTFDDLQVVIDSDNYNSDMKAITDLYLNVQRFRLFMEKQPGNPEPLPTQPPTVQPPPVQPLPVQQAYAPYYAPTQRHTMPMMEYTPPKPRMDRYGNPLFGEEGSVTTASLTNSPGTVFRPLFSEL